MQPPSHAPSPFPAPLCPTRPLASLGTLPLELLAHLHTYSDLSTLQLIGQTCRHLRRSVDEVLFRSIDLGPRGTPQPGSFPCPERSGLWMPSATQLGGLDMHFRHRPVRADIVQVLAVHVEWDAYLPLARVLSVVGQNLTALTLRISGDAQSTLDELKLYHVQHLGKALAGVDMQKLRKLDLATDDSWHLPLALLLLRAPNVQHLNLDNLVPVSYDEPLEFDALQPLKLTRLHVEEPRLCQSTLIQSLIANSPDLTQLSLPSECVVVPPCVLSSIPRLEKLHIAEQVHSDHMLDVRELTIDHSDGCFESTYAIESILHNLPKLETLVIRVRNSCYHVQSRLGEPCCLMDRLQGHFSSRHTTLPPRLTAVCLRGEPTLCPLSRPLPTDTLQLPLTAENADAELPVGVLITGRAITGGQEVVHVQVRRRRLDAFRAWAPVEWEDEDEDLYWLVDRISGVRKPVEYETAKALGGVGVEDGGCGRNLGPG